MAMNMSSSQKTHIGYVMRRLPIYLVKAIDEFGEANRCSTREEAIILVFKSHPMVAKLVDAQRLEAKSQALRKRRAVFNNGGAAHEREGRG
jgi:hypothetical protein